MKFQMVSRFCLAFALAAGPAVVHAQDNVQPEAQSTPGGLQDIIVTARRTSERLQDVPISVTALTGDTLVALGVRSFGDLGKSIPNLVVEKQLGTANSPTFFLRGITTSSTRFETDSGIALYINGVYLGRPAGSSFDLADIDRVEVLRGPQGTLFGRNSTGGAINFITTAPRGVFHVNAEGSIGNYAERRARLSVDLPALGPVSARLTYLHSENDGYVKNLAAGRLWQFPEPFGSFQSVKDFGRDNTDALSAAVRVDLAPVTFDYSFDYTKKRNTQFAQQLIGFNPDFAPTAAAFYTPANNGSQPSTRRESAIALDFTGPTSLRAFGHSLTGAFEMSDKLTLKSISAYRGFNENSRGNDIDGAALELGGAPFSIISALQARHQRQFSQEVQLIGKTDTVDFLAGAFYFRETGVDNSPVFLGTLFPASGPIVPNLGPGTGVGNTTNLFGLPSDYFIGSSVKVRNRSLAGYAHLGWKSEHFELGGGLRYTKDNRREDVLASLLRPFALPPGTFNAKGDNWDFDATATYVINSGSRVYGRFATGFLSSGIINGNSFPKETIDNYELGLKTDLLDRRVRLNVALFHTQRRNIQVLLFDAATGTRVDSLKQGRENGAEVELTVLPVTGITLTGSFGYVDQKLSENPTNGISTPELAPKYTGSMSVQYESPHAPDDQYMTFRFDGNYKHKRFNGGAVNSPVDLTTIPPRIDVNARASLMDIPLGTGKARASFWVQNLINNKKRDMVVDLTTVILGIYQKPRTYGLEIGYSF